MNRLAVYQPVDPTGILDYFHKYIGQIVEIIDEQYIAVRASDGQSWETLETNLHIIYET